MPEIKYKIQYVLISVRKSIIAVVFTNTYIFHEEQAHLDGGDYIAPPCTCLDLYHFFWDRKDVRLSGTSEKIRVASTNSPYGIC